MGDKLMNEGPKWLFIALWLLANLGLFIGYFVKYNTEMEYYYLRKMTGSALAFARGSAACLNFNCFLILLPVCRNLISYLRGSCKCVKRNVVRQLDKNITFHIYVAYSICFFTAIHYFGHTFNFEGFLDAYDSKKHVNQTRELLMVLSNLPSSPDGTWINPIRSPNTTPMLEVVKSVAGITGVIITLCLVIMMSSASELIRRSYYEIFWFTHHLFVIFFIGLVTHGLGGIVRGQSNLDEHDPVFCEDKYKQWGAIDECPDPQFAPGDPGSWKWVIAPIILYMAECCIRFARRFQTVTITKVVKHPSKVIELQMKKSGFKMEAGQYIFIQCPSISRLEWHPFTLTSAPQDDYFSVHIRLVGDWTSELANACGADQQEIIQSSSLPSLSVDGPFGTASEDVYRYQASVLVAAGIGVTPFAAVLKDIWYRSCDPRYEMKLQKVHVYWICPDTNAFEWFADLLKSLEDQMIDAGRGDFLTYNIYLTRGWDSNQALNIISHEQDEDDAITGLRQKTFYGRPNWDHQFKGIAEKHQGTRIGVFFCGPKVLSSTLHKMSNKYSSSEVSGTHFVYNKENF